MPKKTQKVQALHYKMHVIKSSLISH